MANFPRRSPTYTDVLDCTITVQAHDAVLEVGDCSRLPRDPFSIRLHKLDRLVDAVILRLIADGYVISPQFACYRPEVREAGTEIPPTPPLRST